MIREYTHRIVINKDDTMLETDSLREAIEYYKSMVVNSKVGSKILLYTKVLSDREIQA